jgi:hypothetical protein
MNSLAIDLGQLPTSYIVAEALKHYFSQEDIDLRDITDIAKQDPVVLANILFLVNEVYAKRNSPVVNTLSAAINLVGLEPLKQRLLSIKVLDAKDKSYVSYELIRSRIFAAACLTNFWADYMGQAAAEEMYCASMFTGISDLAFCLRDESIIKYSKVDYEVIDTIQTLYGCSDTELSCMPDSIQVVYQNNQIPERLKLSILTYELLARLELGYSTELFKEALLDMCDYIGIGIHRSGYDLARQLVLIDRTANYHVCHHSHYLVTTNLQVVDPIGN